ncbi:MAG: hypothetical protein AAF652_13170 [Cyanobacteria bacterium P01_C01_bin.72]
MELRNNKLRFDLDLDLDRELKRQPFRQPFIEPANDFQLGVGTGGGDEGGFNEGLGEEIEGTIGPDEGVLGTEGHDQINTFGGNDTVFALGGNDIVLLGSGDDFALGYSGHDRIEGEAGDDLISGDTGNDVLNGGSGNDTLVGDRGNDVLTGVNDESPNPGTNEIDFLTGDNSFTDPGADRFILGSVGKVFYRRSSSSSSAYGTEDFALIEDYQPGIDNIVLHGTPNDYILGNSPTSAVQGTNIYYSDEGTLDLIGIVEGVDSNEIDLTFI